MAVRVYMGFNKINVNNIDSNYTHSIFDISEYTGRRYDTLSEALADIPPGKQKGGMTICFISNIINKYVQYNLLNTEWSIIPNDWLIENELIVKNTLSKNNDFIISDELGNAVLELRDGHIFTKFFDSGILKTEFTSSYSDFCLSDELGNAILELRDGHIFTKNFSSRTNIIRQNVFSNYHAIGDSITAGSSVQGKQYFTYLGELCGFSNVTSDGVGGREMSSGIKTALLNIPDNADCVSIFAGTNDWGHHLPLGNIEDTTSSSTMYGSLKYICEWMSTNKPTVGFFFITPIQRNCDIWPADHESTGTWVNSLGLKLDDYVNAIKEVSAFYSIPCLNLFETCFNGHSNVISNVYMSDGLHPNVAGHQIMARKISKFINFKL